MFDAPIDTWHRWVGVAGASLAVLAAAAGLPTGSAPDAAAAGTTVDSIAASTHPAVAEHPLTAEQIRVGPGAIGLRGAGGTAITSLSYGPVTPVLEGTRLDAVLSGTPPSRVFDTPAAFARAAATARDRTPVWRQAGDRLLVRRVSWKGTDVTLVGA